MPSVLGRLGSLARSTKKVAVLGLMSPIDNTVVVLAIGAKRVLLVWNQRTETNYSYRKEVSSFTLVSIEKTSSTLAKGWTLRSARS